MVMVMMMAILTDDYRTRSGALGLIANHFVIIIVITNGGHYASSRSAPASLSLSSSSSSSRPFVKCSMTREGERKLARFISFSRCPK